MALLRQRDLAACFVVCQADFHFWFLLVWVWKSSQDWWNCSYPVSIVIVSGKIDLAFAFWEFILWMDGFTWSFRRISYQKVVAFLRKSMESNSSKRAFPVKYTVRVHRIRDYFLRSALTGRLENCICLKERGQGPKPLKELWKKQMLSGKNGKRGLKGQIVCIWHPPPHGGLWTPPFCETQSFALAIPKNHSDPSSLSWLWAGELAATELSEFSGCIWGFHPGWWPMEKCGNDSKMNCWGLDQ